jgi:hypothetical protein
VPAVWPETYSFSTREALATGLPVIAFDIGAQGEAVGRARMASPCPMTPMPIWLPRLHGGSAIREAPPGAGKDASALHRCAGGRHENAHHPNSVDRRCPFSLSDACAPEPR